MQQKWYIQFQNTTKIKTNISTIIKGDFNMPLSQIGQPDKINQQRNIVKLVDQMDLICIV